MKAIISIITGMIAFVIISGMQLNMILITKLHNMENQLTPTVHAIGKETKIMVILFALTAIITSVLYSRTKQKHKIINKVGMLLGIIAILLCFIPLYLMIK